jgi:hypothetical protein
VALGAPVFLGVARGGLLTVILRARETEIYGDLTRWRLLIFDAVRFEVSNIEQRFVREMSINPSRYKHGGPVHESQHATPTRYPNPKPIVHVLAVAGT